MGRGGNCLDSFFELWFQLITAPCTVYWQVVGDRSEGFFELWGHSWAPTRQQQTTAAAEELFGTAFESGSFWCLVLLYALASFSAVAGAARAYHALSALGAMAAAMVWLHLHPG